MRRWMAGVLGVVGASLIVGCGGSAAGFDYANSTQQLSAGRYSVVISAQSCGNAPTITSAAGSAFTAPLINGATITIPADGYYTISDPDWNAVGGGAACGANDWNIALQPA